MTAEQHYQNAKSLASGKAILSEKFQCFISEMRSHPRFHNNPGLNLLSRLYAENFFTTADSLQKYIDGFPIK